MWPTCTNQAGWPFLERRAARPCERNLPDDSWQPPACRLGTPSGNGPHGVDLRPQLPRSIDAPTCSSYLFLAESPRLGFRPGPALLLKEGGRFIVALHHTPTFS